MGQPFFIDAAGIQQLVFEDGVIHAHAAFVEDAEDRLFLQELARQRLSLGALGLGQPARVQVADVAGVVRDDALADPLADAA